MPRSRGLTAIAVLYVLLTGNAAWQVADALSGSSSDPSPLTMLQAGIAVAAAVTAWLTWRGSTRAWVAALIHCAVSVGMLVALPSLIDIDPDGRNGVYFGAATMLLLGAGVTWYLHRASTPRARGNPAAPGGA